MENQLVIIRCTDDMIYSTFLLVKLISEIIVSMSVFQHWLVSGRAEAAEFIHICSDTDQRHLHSLVAFLNKASQEIFMQTRSFCFWLFAATLLFLLLHSFLHALYSFQKLYPFSVGIMGAFLSLLTGYIAPLFIIISPITSYADQTWSIHRNKSSAGFSLDIPLIMLVASFMR